MGLLDQVEENTEEEPRLDPDDPSRLFQTVSRNPRSSRDYLKVFLSIAGIVVVALLAFFYFTSPGVGDEIKPSQPLELAVRYHLLEKEGRVAGDITFYKCEGSTWARAQVEARPDIPNPKFQTKEYAVKAVPNGEDSWAITAKPIAAGEKPVPCSDL